MTFSTENAFSVEKKDVAFLEAGIHEGVDYVGTRKERGSTGNLFIEFEFNKNGYKLTHTEWEPTKSPNQTEEEFVSKVNNQAARMLQILGVWYEKETLQNFTYDSIETLYTWVKNLLDAADKNQKIRLKAIYNDKGYTSLPKYAKYTFIENMSIPSEKSKIKKLNIDNFERPVIGDTEQDAKSSASVFGTNVTVKDDQVPF